MNGILLVNKPTGLTSFDCLRKIRKMLDIKKIGHSGTLDPLATGVLVVLLGDATKLSEYMMSEVKSYEFEVIFGIMTDTDDVCGKVILEETTNDITNELIDNVLKHLHGKIDQIPPMYSAIKVNGKKLYDYARSGTAVERKSREIEVFDLKRISDVTKYETYQKCKFSAVVSKGTYIRSLATQIGEKISKIAAVSQLHRTTSGNYTIDNCYSLENIENGDYEIINMVDATKKYRQIEVDDYLKNKVLHGMKISFKDIECDDNEIFFVCKDKLLGIYQRSDMCYRAYKVWN